MKSSCDAALFSPSRNSRHRIQRSLLNGASIAACLLAFTPAAEAVDGQWSSPVSGLWSEPTNWFGPVADGVDATASFDLVDLAADVTVSLDTPRTIGNLIFSDVDPSTAGGWLLNDNGNPANVLTLAVTTGSPTITVNPLGTGEDVTISTVLAGTGGFTKAGAGTLVLTGANTISGGISLDAGVLAINGDAALGAAGSGLTFTNTSTLRFDAAAELAAGRTITLNAGATATLDTQANAVTIASAFAGGGRLTKVGSGQLTYTGTGSFDGPLNIDGGEMIIGTGGSLTTGALTTASNMRLYVNGGSYTANGLSTINPFSTGGFQMDSGSATFNGGIRSSGTADNTVIIVNGGTFTASSVELRRDQNSSTSFTRGFIFRDGVGSVGTMAAGTSNSWGHISIEGGTFTASGTITIGNQVTSGRGGAMRVTGGTFTSTDTVDGIVLGKTNTTNSNNVAIANFSGGTSTVEKFTLGFDETVTAGSSTINVNNSAASLYIGSGGIVKKGAAGLTTNVNLTAGLLGAKADWTSDVGVSFGTTDANNFTIKAADEAGVPHNITINGSLSGTGDFTKTGGGTLILGANSNSYTGGTVGSTTIAEGTLQLGNGGTAGNIGTSPITNNGTLAFNRTDTLTVANTVTGTGALAQNGTGTTVLTGALSHTGGTNVNAGTLRVATALPGTVTVNTGGTLGGAATASGAVQVNNGGIIDPSDAAGTGTGTLSLGMLTLEAGSRLDFDFASLTTHDQVNVLDLNGLTINGTGVNLFALNTTDPWTIPGTYNLFQYNGALGGVAGTDLDAALTILNPQSGFTYDFGTNNNFITLDIISQEVFPTWANIGGGSWATASNWDPSIPNAQDATAVFGNSITAASTVSLDGDKTVGTLRFANSTAAYTIAQGTGGTLFLNRSTGEAVIENVSGNHIINVPVSLTSNTLVNVFDANDALTISGNVTGTGELSKVGLGTLVLSGANNHAGGTNLNAGTIRIATNQSLGSAPLRFTGAGVLQAGAANLTVSNSIILSAATTGTFDSNGQTITIASTISDTAVDGGVNKVGAGKVILTGTNTYGGPTTVTAGTLSVADIPNGGTPGPLGQSSNAAANLVLNGGTLEYTGAGGSTDRLFRLGTQGGGIAASGSGPLRLEGVGAISLAGTNTPRTFTLSGTNTGDNALVSTLGNNGTGATSLVKSGPGLWVLESANTFSGTTVISGGTLTLFNPLALQNSTLNYDNQGGAIDFFVLSAATLGGLSGAQDLPVPAGFQTLTLGNNNQAASYSGALTVPNLVKVGTGTQTLSGTNTFTETTDVVGGTLQLATGGSLTTPDLDLFVGVEPGTLAVDGGALTVTGQTQFGTNDQNRGHLVINSGTVDLQGGALIKADESSLRITGGTVNINGVTIERNSGSDTNNFANVGFIVSGGTTTTSSIRVATGNSWGTMTMTGGELTNTGAFIIGNQATTNRGARLRVSGGTLLSTDPSGLIVGARSNNLTSATFSGGTSTFEKITLIGDDTVTGTTADLNLTGGTVYLGSGGLVANTGGGSTANVNLTSGTLGAIADWSSTQNMTLIGPTTFQAADAGGVAHNITLSGQITGFGNLTKTGSGTLEIAGDSNFSGEAIVTDGDLLVSGALSGVSAVKVTGGEVRLGKSEAISDFADVGLGGGVLDTAGFSETVGELTLTVGSSSIDLGDGASLLRFAASNGETWDGTLSILNWSGSTTGGGTDQLFFGTDASGLTAAQLASIQFINPNGIPGAFEANMLPSGEIVTIPEPGSFLALLSGTALLLGSRRRRRAV